MRYLFTYEPPQPNSPSEIVVYQDYTLPQPGDIVLADYILTLIAIVEK